MDKVVNYTDLEIETLKMFRRREIYNKEEEGISEAESFDKYFEGHKELLKSQGYIIVYDEVEEYYPMLKKGNYLSKWMILETRTPQIFDLVEKKYSFFRGKKEVHKNPKTEEIDLDLFYEVLERNEINKELLKTDSSYKISAAKFNRSDVVDLLISGIVTSTPSGLYIRKEEKNCLK